MAKDFDKSPKFVQRSYQFVKVLDSIEEKTSPEVVAEETGVSPDTVWKSFQPQEEGRGLFRDYDLDC